MLAAAGSVAQTPPPSNRGLVVEVNERQRWLHGRQLSRFTPFADDRTWLFIRSMEEDSARRRYRVNLRFRESRDTAIIVINPSPRPSEVRLGLAPFAIRDALFPGDSADIIERSRGERRIVHARLADLLPAFPQAAPRVGLTWTDTLASATSDGPYRRSLRGTRVSRITGDSIVGGRRLWVVRDSASVRYEDAYLEEERTLDTTVQITRVATGTVRGTHLLDGDLRLFLARADTTHLQGEATLRYPDGRSFRTPARYERMRRWIVYDSAGHAARLAEISADNCRRRGGMVFTPSNALERRLSDGDTVARDSLIREWRQMSDPDKADTVFRMLRMWSARSEASRALLERVRLEAGDTASLYGRLANSAFSTQGPTDSADVQAMLRFMEDPSLAWSYNLSRDWLYENLVQALTTSPRATARDSMHVACTIAACRLLASQWRTAREPRLRDVALVALMTTDPRPWSDTVLALDSARHPLLRSAKLLATGRVGATARASLKAPIPPPNSGAPAWIEWMSGVDPRWAAAFAKIQGPASRAATPRVVFDGQHATAIRFYVARTGRDVVGELQRSYRAATSDSVRLVFGTMLRGLGELQLTEAEIANDLVSGIEARVELARESLVSRLDRTSAPMDDTKDAALVDRLLAAVIDSASLWRDERSPTRRRNRAWVHARIVRALIDKDSVPMPLRAKWAGRAELISQSEWKARDPRVGGVFYTMHTVRTWGRFARVEITLSERLDRSADLAPAQFAAGTTYYLMELNGEWVIVDVGGWIT